jgi:hypothetical protein
MTPEELQQCLEDAFGGLETPRFEELGTFYPEEEFLDVVKTGTDRTKRWQELRPLTQYLNGSLDVFLLTPKAFQYYLPAYLHAMTDPEVIWQYLSHLLTKLWYEDEDGDLLFDDPTYREKWEQFAALLTDRQKRCIAHCLVEFLKSADSIEHCAEVHMETDRIEHMLKKYWNAWL